MFVCPPAARTKLPVRGTCLAVGFGIVTVERDGITVWSGDDERVSLYRFEKMARQESASVWTVYFYGPLQGRKYRRVGLNKWELISTDRGFA